MRCKTKGFVLVETLIVSVFIMVLLSLLYANLFPVVAEYERRKNYDTVEAKYIAHWARKMLIDSGKENAFVLVDGYLDVTDCSYYTNPSWCEEFKEMNQISKIYITNYNLQEFKNYVKTSNRFGRSMEEYIASLPDYKEKPGVYRVIVEVIGSDTNQMIYGTIEVKK